LPPKKKNAALARLIERVGFVVPVIADENLTILAGGAAGDLHRLGRALAFRVA
jgi:hypothetical protein